MPNDFEAQMDLETLAQAKEIEKDPSRVDRAKRFAEKKSEEYGQLSKSLPGKPARRFNGAGRDSKMVGT